MSANITNGGEKHSSQTTLSGEVVSENAGAKGLEGLGAILWRVGREHPDLPTKKQARIACERAKENGVELGGGSE